VESADKKEVTASPDTLTFTTNNWNVPQYVILRGVSDSADDGTQRTKVKVSVDSGAGYGNVEKQTIEVMTIDVN